MTLQMQDTEDSFDRIVDHMGSMMEELLSRNYFRSSARDSWTPALNLYETAERYVLCVDLAGMERDEIQVEADRDVLRLHGTRPRPALSEPPHEVSVHVMEIDSGRFHRKIPLPADVDRDRIEADYRHGYLWITLPRRCSAGESTEAPTSRPLEGYVKGRTRRRRS